MRKFVSAATAFYFLDEGEMLGSAQIYGDESRIYVIWPVSGVWKVRYRFHKGWESISSSDFETENIAFNFAYEHFLKLT